MPGRPSSPAGAAQCYHPPRRCAQKPPPSRVGGRGEAGQGSGDSTNRSRGVGWDGNGDEVGTEWVWDGVRDREEDVKRGEWDGNEVGLDGVGKGMR